MRWLSFCCCIAMAISSYSSSDQLLAQYTVIVNSESWYLRQYRGLIDYWGLYMGNDKLYAYVNPPDFNNENNTVTFVINQDDTKEPITVHYVPAILTPHNKVFHGTAFGSP